MKKSVVVTLIIGLLCSVILTSMTTKSEKTEAYHYAILMNYEGKPIKVWEGDIANIVSNGTKTSFYCNGKQVHISGGIFYSE